MFWEIKNWVSAYWFENFQPNYMKVFFKLFSNYFRAGLHSYRYEVLSINSLTVYFVPQLSVCRISPRNKIPLLRTFYELFIDFQFKFHAQAKLFIVLQQQKLIL